MSCASRSRGCRCCSRSCSPSRFSSASIRPPAFNATAYIFTLSAALVSTSLLIAPSAYHRLNFRRRDKQRIVEFANRCVIAGLAVLAVAMVSVMVLISDVLFGGAVVIVAPTLSAALLLVLWAALPLRERSRTEDQADLRRPAPSGRVR